MCTHPAVYYASTNLIGSELNQQVFEFAARIGAIAAERAVGNTA